MKARRGPSFSLSLPAPIMGWNARDALGDMGPNYAVTLENFFPGTSDVVMRYGYTNQSTGIVDGQVETLMAYAGSTTNKLFGIAGTKVYDCTTTGAVGAASVTGLSNARWQYANMSTSGGNYLQMVNGLDKLRVFNGATWFADGDGSPYDITGVDSATCIQINVHKNRVWLIKKNTLTAWYLPTSSIGGAANSLSMQAIAYKGGSLVAMGTWTIDSGLGVDDLAVFITSKGQVIVYKGTDPASSTTWALVGVWDVGTPIGTRCFMKFGGDILLITQDGVLPLAQALQSSRLDPRVALTNIIDSAVSNAASLYGSTFGWQLVYFPQQGQLLLNVPITVGTQQQYVMNTITKAWCNFTGWAANCWEVFNDDLYFGGNQIVGQAWNGLIDNVTAISADGLQAFNYFGKRGILKRFTMMRPVLATSGNPATLAAVNIDFDTSDPTSPLSFTATNYGMWDTGRWDTALWGADLTIAKAWQGVTGVGYCAAPRLKVTASSIETRWVSTDLVAEPGGIL